jgi:hypothetical protein
MSKNKQKIQNEAPKVKPLGDLKIAESRGMLSKYLTIALKVIISDASKFYFLLF